MNLYIGSQESFQGFFIKFSQNQQLRFDWQPKGQKPAHKVLCLGVIIRVAEFDILEVFPAPKGVAIEAAEHEALI